MNNPALKVSVDKQKMLRQISQRLRTGNMVLSRFGSCIVNTSKKFSISKGMFNLQVHFFPPKSTQEKKARANFFDLVHRDGINPFNINNLTKSNLVNWQSSLCLKTEVSLPLM